MSLIKAMLGICKTKPLGDSSWNMEGNQIYIKLNEMPLPPEGATYLKGKGLQKPVFIFRSADDQYLAFQNRCTHIGHRRLDPVPGENKIRCCSVFHSTYDLDGNPISGPARNQLKKYEVQQSGDDLIITL